MAKVRKLAGNSSWKAKEKNYRIHVKKKKIANNNDDNKQWQESADQKLMFELNMHNRNSTLLAVSIVIYIMPLLFCLIPLKDSSQVSL